MPNHAIAKAIAATPKEDLRYVPRSYGGYPPGYRSGPPWEQVAELCIAEGEVVSEEEADRRLTKSGFVSDATQIINGTTPIIATMLGQGRWQYADYRAATLERSRPVPRPSIRSVFKPPSSSESKELRQLRGQVRELSALVSGEAPAMPAVYVGAGKALIRNPHRYELRLAELLTMIGPGEVLEVGEEYAARAVSTGVLHRITAEEASRLLAANAPL